MVGIAPHWYLVQGSDTTMLTIAPQLVQQKKYTAKVLKDKAAK